MTYEEQLNSQEWKAKRSAILNRDGWCCQSCSNQEIIKNSGIGLFLMSLTPIHIQAIQIGLIKTTEELELGDLIRIKSKSLPQNAFNNSTLVFFDYPNAYERIVALRDLTEEEQQNIILPNSARVQKSIQSKNSMDYFDQNSEMLDNYSSEDFLNDAKEACNQLKSRILENLDKKVKWRYSIGLNIHHTYYQEGKMAWEYPPEALITVCVNCHKEIHGNTLIPHLSESGIEISKLTPCKKCHSAGWFPEFKHIQEGICFSCNGARYEELIQR